MTYSVPTFKVEVALTATPLDDFEAISSWTDLSDRVMEVSTKRGRSDQLAQFQTGTASIVLDNSDRQLDPQNDDGLVPVSANKGLPFCPVRLTLGYKGSTYPLMARAYIAAEGWPGQRAPHGTDATVTLNVVDATGLFAWLGMPSSYWRAIVGQIVPDWWLPGEVVAPADTADGFHINNRSGSGGWATTEAANTRTVTDGVLNETTTLTSASAAFTLSDVGRLVTGTGIPAGTTIASRVDATEVVMSQAATATASGVTVLIGNTVSSPLLPTIPLTQFDSMPTSETAVFGSYGYTRYALPASGWQQKPLVSLVSAEADVFPDGDVDDLTFSFMWLSDRYDSGSLAGDSEVDLCRIEGSGGIHLRLFLDGLDSNSMNLQILDGTGAELTTITAPPPTVHGSASYGDNWDDAASHGIVVRVVGGTSVDLFVDDKRATELVDVPASAFAGDFVIGEVPLGGFVAVFDEVMLVRRALTDTECERLASAPSAGVTWGRGEELAERLQLFYDAAGWTLLTDEDDEWHPPPASITSPEAPTLIGVAERGAGWPKTLGEALSRVAAGIGGDFYALRNGKVRVRSLLATEDAGLAAEYATSLAHLTDEVSPAGSPPPVRRGPVSWSGTRFDRTVTVAEVSYLAYASVPEPPALPTSAQQVYVDTKWVEATPDAYMPRTRSASLDTESSLVAEALALAFLDRYGTPGIEIGAVTVYPTRSGDSAEAEALMDFVVTDLELERLVSLTDTPPVGDPISVDLNVQGESWRWDGTDLVVTVNLART